MKSEFINQMNLTIKLIMFSMVFIFSSCSKDENENTEVKAKDNYYVRYEITGNGAYGRFSNWEVKTPDGIYSNKGTQVGRWSQTYGPVSKGFKCGVEIGNYISGAPTIEIYVAKNEEPFALKVSATGKSASYTISF